MFPTVPALSFPTGNRVIKKRGVGADNQEKVAYAYQLGGENFVYLLNAENGQWTYKRKHPKVKGTIGIDWGFCGINDYYHPDIVKNPKMFTDWKWQMDQCYQLYRKGTTFYGAKHIAKQKQFFTY